MRAEKRQRRGGEEERLRGEGVGEVKGREERRRGEGGREKKKRRGEVKMREERRMRAGEQERGGTGLSKGYGGAAGPTSFIMRRLYRTQT